jgi:hypothetical protein
MVTATGVGVGVVGVVVFFEHAKIVAPADAAAIRHIGRTNFKIGTFFLAKYSGETSRAREAVFFQFTIAVRRCQRFSALFFADSLSSDDEKDRVAVMRSTRPTRTHQGGFTEPGTQLGSTMLDA